MGTEGFSSGLGFRSGIVSVEKVLGSKPMGDGDRMNPLPGKDGASWGLCSSFGLLLVRLEEGSGDSDGSRLIHSLVEPGEPLSGFAIRKPPSDWVRFMLLAITVYLVRIMGETIVLGSGSERQRLAAQCHKGNSVQHRLMDRYLNGGSNVSCYAHLYLTQSRLVYRLSISSIR